MSNGLSRDHLRVAITTGDINGIGPEIVLKAVAELEEIPVQWVLVDPAGVLPWWLEKLSLPRPSWRVCTTLPQPEEDTAKAILLVDEREADKASVDIGRPTSLSGRIAHLALTRAIDLALHGQAAAVVTAPVSKLAVQLAGIAFSGQTELLAERCNVSTPVMMLIGKTLRVAVLTRHVPLARVASLISKDLVLNSLFVLAKDLRGRFRIPAPRIAVCGLNPHAGEGGTLGREEVDIIAPAVRAAQEAGLLVEGPLPADALFSRVLAKESFDVVLAMYHDQGLIPIKMIAGGAGVNYTAGLPFVRTSPDHGTAFDIAGTNTADPTSMKEAIRLAIQLVQKR